MVAILGCCSSWVDDNRRASSHKPGPFCSLTIVVSRGRVWRPYRPLYVEPMKLWNVRFESFGRMSMVILILIPCAWVGRIGNYSWWACFRHLHKGCVSLWQQEVVVTLQKAEMQYSRHCPEVWKLAVWCFYRPMLIWDVAWNQARSLLKECN